MRRKILFATILTFFILAGCTEDRNKKQDVINEEAKMPRANLQRTGVYQNKGGAVEKVLWQIESSSQVESTPVVSQGIIIWGGRDGILRAHLLSNGQDVWSQQLDGPVLNSLVVHDGAVFVTTSRGTFFQIGLKSGEVKEKKSLGKPVTTPALIWDKLLVFGFRDGTVEAYQIESLDKVWSLKTEGAIQGGLALSKGTLFFGSMDNFLRAIDVVSGKEKWRFNTRGAVVSTPVALDERVYIGSRSRVFFALDAELGELIWHFSPGNEIRTSAAATKSRVVIASENNRVYCLSAETGQALWHVQTNGIVDTGPVIADGKVYFGSRDRHVYALDLTSGQVISKWDGGDWIMADPVPIEGSLVVVTRNGRLARLE